MEPSNVTQQWKSCSSDTSCNKPTKLPMEINKKVEKINIENVNKPAPDPKKLKRGLTIASHLSKKSDSDLIRTGNQDKNCKTGNQQHIDQSSVLSRSKDLKTLAVLANATLPNGNWTLLHADTCRSNDLSASNCIVDNSGLALVVENDSINLQNLSERTVDLEQFPPGSFVVTTSPSVNVSVQNSIYKENDVVVNVPRTEFMSNTIPPYVKNGDIAFGRILFVNEITEIASSETIPNIVEDDSSNVIDLKTGSSEKNIYTSLASNGEESIDVMSKEKTMQVEKEISEMVTDPRVMAEVVELTDDKQSYDGTMEWTCVETEKRQSNTNSYEMNNDGDLVGKDVLRISQSDVKLPRTFTTVNGKNSETILEIISDSVVKENVTLEVVEGVNRVIIVKSPLVSAQSQLLGDISESLFGSRTVNQFRSERSLLPSQNSLSSYTCPLPIGSSFVTLNHSGSVGVPSPSAFILPSGQIVPVVTQPSFLNHQLGLQRQPPLCTALPLSSVLFPSHPSIIKLSNTDNGYLHNVVILDSNTQLNWNDSNFDSSNINTDSISNVESLAENHRDCGPVESEIGALIAVDNNVGSDVIVGMGNQKLAPAAHINETQLANTVVDNIEPNFVPSRNIDMSQNGALENDLKNISIRSKGLANKRAISVKRMRKYNFSFRAKLYKKQSFRNKQSNSSVVMNKNTCRSNSKKRKNKFNSESLKFLDKGVSSTEFKMFLELFSSFVKNKTNHESSNERTSRPNSDEDMIREDESDKRQSCATHSPRIPSLNEDETEKNMPDAIFENSVVEISEGPDENIVTNHVTDVREHPATNNVTNHVTDVTDLPVANNVTNHVTDVTEHPVTNNVTNHVTDVTVLPVANNVTNHVTDVTVHHVTDSVENHVTDVTNHQVTNHVVNRFTDCLVSRYSEADSAGNRVTSSILNQVKDRVADVVDNHDIGIKQKKSNDGDRQCIRLEQTLGNEKYNRNPSQLNVPTSNNCCILDSNQALNFHQTANNLSKVSKNLFESTVGRVAQPPEITALMKNMTASTSRSLLYDGISTSTFAPLKHCPTTSNVTYANSYTPMADSEMKSGKNLWTPAGGRNSCCSKEFYSPATEKKSSIPDKYAWYPQSPFIDKNSKCSSATSEMNKTEYLVSSSSSVEFSSHSGLDAQKSLLGRSSKKFCNSLNNPSCRNNFNVSISSNIGGSGKYEVNNLVEGRQSPTLVGRIASDNNDKRNLNSFGDESSNLLPGDLGFTENDISSVLDEVIFGSPSGHDKQSQSHGGNNFWHHELFDSAKNMKEKEKASESSQAQANGQYRSSQIEDYGTHMEYTYMSEKDGKEQTNMAETFQNGRPGLLPPASTPWPIHLADTLNTPEKFPYRTYVDFPFLLSGTKSTEKNIPTPCQNPIYDQKLYNQFNCSYQSVDHLAGKTTSSSNDSTQTGSAKNSALGCSGTSSGSIFCLAQHAASTISTTCNENFDSMMLANKINLSYSKAGNQRYNTGEYFERNDAMYSLNFGKNVFNEPYNWKLSGSSHETLQSYDNQASGMYQLHDQGSDCRKSSSTRLAWSAESVCTSRPEPTKFNSGCANGSSGYCSQPLVSFRPQEEFDYAGEPERTAKSSLQKKEHLQETDFNLFPRPTAGPLLHTSSALFANHVTDMPSESTAGYSFEGWRSSHPPNNDIQSQAARKQPKDIFTPAISLSVASSSCTMPNSHAPEPSFNFLHPFSTSGHNPLSMVSSVAQFFPPTIQSDYNSFPLNLVPTFGMPFAPDNICNQSRPEKKPSFSFYPFAYNEAISSIGNDAAAKMDELVVSQGRSSERESDKFNFSGVNPPRTEMNLVENKNRGCSKPIASNDDCRSKSMQNFTTVAPYETRNSFVHSFSPNKLTTQINSCHESHSTQLKRMPDHFLGMSSNPVGRIGDNPYHHPGLSLSDPLSSPPLHHHPHDHPSLPGASVKFALPNIQLRPILNFHSSFDSQNICHPNHDSSKETVMEYEQEKVVIQKSRGEDKNVKDSKSSRHLHTIQQSSNQNPSGKNTAKRSTKTAKKSSKQAMHSEANTSSTHQDTDTTYFSQNFLPKQSVSSDGPTYFANNGPHLSNIPEYQHCGSFNQLFNPSSQSQGPMNLNFQQPSTPLGLGAPSSSTSTHPKNQSNTRLPVLPSIHHFGFGNIFQDFTNPSGLGSDGINLSPVKLSQNGSMLPPTQMPLVDPSSVHYQQISQNSFDVFQPSTPFSAEHSPHDEHKQSPRPPSSPHPITDAKLRC